MRGKARADPGLCHVSASRRKDAGRTTGRIAATDVDAGARGRWKSVDALAPRASTPGTRFRTPDINLDQASTVPVQ
jgi:hypothetical protein